MLPDSNQQSMTSGILSIIFLHLSHFRWILSTICLCRSTILGSLPIVFFLNSSTLPITFMFPHLHFQTGIEVAQNMFLEILQSGAVSKIFLNLPSFKCSGYQFISLFFLSSSFFTFCISTNQESTAL